MKLKNASRFMKKQPNQNLSKLTLLAFAFLSLGISANAQIIRTDFNREKVWFKDYRANEKWIDVAAVSKNPSVLAKIEWGKFGTLDVANTFTPSEALVLTVENPKGITNWESAINSGLLASKNTEQRIDKLTFSFDNAVSSLRPVIVRIESFNAEKKRTGGLEKMIYPATVNHFVRSAFELSEMTAFGNGKFNPLDPYVSFSFSISDILAHKSDSEKYKLTIDNVMYSIPAYYVSPNGNDNNNGRSEKTPFANPQKALDLAKAGDIILLMEGVYKGAKASKAVAKFAHTGNPSAWITLKNYPGQKATLLCHAKNGINILHEDANTIKESPLFSYLEVRGINIKGNSDKVPELFPEERGLSTPNTETKGINITGATGPTRMYHHIRIADCVIENCGADGIWASEVDYLTLENNTIRNNCWTSVDGVSAGFSLMMYANFDPIDNVTKILVRNNKVYGNERKTKRKVKDWAPVIFNGNGILIDANCEAYIFPDFYLGRTLVQNNLVYGNGGGGIQNYGSHRLDIVSNTLYHNGISPELKWGNIGLDFCNDVRIINNIVVALPDRPLDRWMEARADRDTSKIIRVNNLYFGGEFPNIKGDGDIVADPLFINPAINQKDADFRLKSLSPALKAGTAVLDIVPISDISGKIRYQKNATNDRGAYQFEK